MEYSVAIRTLGRAKDKYLMLLNSLKNQSIPPKKILVYIAEGYELPEETIKVEEYIYVKKGMVAQRALRYDEIDTEYILFLDDDVFLPPNSVELLFHQMQDYNADIISPDVFPNSQRTKWDEIQMYISGRMKARHGDNEWGYKVMRTAGYSYNSNPVNDVYLSQTNAGPCFFCKKSTMIDTHFEDELWLDMISYPQGEDQAMFYKMYKRGYKQLTSYNSGIIHLDAGGNRNPEKEKMLIYSDFRFKTIFWHRFIFMPETSVIHKIIDCIAIGYAFGFALLISTLRLRFDILNIKLSAMKDGVNFIQSDEYKNLPKI